MSWSALSGFHHSLCRHFQAWGCRTSVSGSVGRRHRQRDIWTTMTIDPMLRSLQVKSHHVSHISQMGITPQMISGQILFNRGPIYWQYGRDLSANKLPFWNILGLGAMSLQWPSEFVFGIMNIYRCFFLWSHNLNSLVGIFYSLRLESPKSVPNKVHVWNKVVSHIHPLCPLCLPTPDILQHLMTMSSKPLNRAPLDANLVRNPQKICIDNESTILLVAQKKNQKLTKYVIANQFFMIWRYFSGHCRRDGRGAQWRAKIFTEKKCMCCSTLLFLQNPVMLGNWWFDTLLVLNPSHEDEVAPRQWKNIVEIPWNLKCLQKGNPRLARIIKDTPAPL